VLEDTTETALTGVLIVKAEAVVATRAVAAAAVESFIVVIVGI
jgi:hypothetical protein